MTKDLGHLSDDAYLFYEGRADDIINCGGIKISPEVLETTVYQDLKCSSGLAICRKTDAMRGEGFLVAVEKEAAIDQRQLYDRVLQATQSLGVNAANAITIVEVDHLPKTVSGKIQRRQLAQWYASQPTKVKETHADHQLMVGTPIEKIFYRVLKIRRLQAQDTFISLGGDSLSYVQFSMELERHYGYLPKNWENLPIAELEKLEPRRQSMITTIESSVLFRALAIIGVVTNHSGLMDYNYIGGGVMLLFVIAGMNLARFQGDALMQGKWLPSLLSLLQNLLLPYLLLALAYEAYKQNFQPGTLLLYGNFLGTSSSQDIFPTWFIQVLVQSLILFSLLFSIRQVRQLACLSPWKFGLGLLAIAIALRVFIPYLWETRYLYNRVPHMMIWLIILGWCIHFAHSYQEKLIMTMILLSIMVLGIGPGNSMIWWIVLGSLMLTWLPYVHIIKAAKTMIQMIGAATYYIFLTHMIFIHILKVLKIHSPVVNVIGAVLGSTAVWWLTQALLQHLFARKWGEDVHQNDLKTG